MPTPLRSEVLIDPFAVVALGEVGESGGGLRTALLSQVRLPLVRTPASDWAAIVF